MSLLRDIQNDAVNPNLSLSDLLRKCKILASRLGSAEFKIWIDNELIGYMDSKLVPDYRVLRVFSKGDFSGPFQSGLKNADIPIDCLPEEIQEPYSFSYISLPVAALENMIADPNGGNPREPWNPNLVAIIGANIYQGMNCMQAWKVIPINAISGILDIIRTKILTFALEIEFENPDAGEAQLKSNPLPEEKLQNIVNNIYGNVSNLAINSSDVKQTNIISEMNDELFTQLLEAIKDTELILKTQLIAIIENMRHTQGSSDFKSHYIKFMEIVSTHMQILGISLAPLLSALANLLH